jgi:hypothetical protein
VGVTGAIGELGMLAPGAVSELVEPPSLEHPRLDVRTTAEGNTTLHASAAVEENRRNDGGFFMLKRDDSPGGSLRTRWQSSGNSVTTVRHKAAIKSLVAPIRTP